MKESSDMKDILSISKFVKASVRSAPDQLIWFPTYDIGWYPVKTGPDFYDDNYIKTFEMYALSQMGTDITEFRVDFVKSHYPGRVIDIGIGCGDFISKHGDALGYDVSRYGINWLVEHGLWHNCLVGDLEAVTFWDSFEHIHGCWDIIKRVKKWVFMTIPIMKSMKLTPTSRHYKPDEHCWYFTHAGIKQCMNDLGFDLRCFSEAESDLGRRDVLSFAFEARSL